MTRWRMLGRQGGVASGRKVRIWRINAGRDVTFLAAYQAQGLRTPHAAPNSPLSHPGQRPPIPPLHNGLLTAAQGLQQHIVNQVVP